MQRTLSLVLVAALATTTMAQKLLVKSGNFKELKSEKELDLEFTFDNMTVGKYAEAEYIAKKKTEYNDKEPGRGEQFEKSWLNDRESRFAPKFEELLNDAEARSKACAGPRPPNTPWWCIPPSPNPGITSVSLKCPRPSMRTSR
ncbi:MAG: hypothetical protein IPK99_10055 [Flavobacteriales bacterium]|nr:hypothetical protein [Flavobacteriales bacterium]